MLPVPVSAYGHFLPCIFLVYFVYLSYIPYQVICFLRVFLHHLHRAILCPFFFLAALGLHCCAWALSSCGKQGLLFIVVRGLLIAVASLVAEQGL